jgi:hypothetical protein
MKLVNWNGTPEFGDVVSAGCASIAILISSAESMAS